MGVRFHPKHSQGQQCESEATLGGGQQLHADYALLSLCAQHGDAWQTDAISTTAISTDVAEKVSDMFKDGNEKEFAMNSDVPVDDDDNVPLFVHDAWDDTDDISCAMSQGVLGYVTCQPNVPGSMPERAECVWADADDLTPPYLFCDTNSRLGRGPEGQGYFCQAQHSQHCAGGACALLWMHEQEMQLEES
eukprot:5689930-Amphidinium_carterae.2